MLLYLAFAVMGFLCGGVMFSYHLPKIFCKIDITEKSADKNPGTANAIKYGGVFIGMLCLILDLGKGFAPVFISGMFLDRFNPLFAAVIAAPVLGHAVALFYKFSGGKGIAAAFGCMLGLIPFSYCALILAVLYITAAGIVRIKPNEKCSVIVFALFSLIETALFLRGAPISVFIGCVIISAVCGCKNFIDYKHRYKQALSKPAMHNAADGCADEEEPAHDLPLR